MALESVAAAGGGVDGAGLVRGAGRVKAEGAHEWRDMSTADVLSAGVIVQAASDQPLEMNLPDGVSVTLEPSGLAKWMPAGKLPSEVNRWTRGYHLVLEDGELEVRMPDAPKGAHAFLVSTKAGTLTDWRGQLHVRVQGDSAAAAIYQGALVVGSNGQGFPVYDGAGILMRRGVNPDKTRGIPATPQWETRSGGFLMEGADGGGAVRLSWLPAANAASYRVEVATDALMVRVVDRATSTDTHYTTTQSAHAGRYWAHVRAVGPEGIVGAWSTPQLVRVLRYQLPPGAFIARDGAIVLPDGGSLTFPGAEGLEVAFETIMPALTARPVASSGVGPDLATTVPHRVEPTLYWSPLGTSLRLPEHAPTRIIHLRDPISGTETRLVLARRQLHADVDLSPATARWPRDWVRARVRVSDPSGRIDVGGEAITIEAALDLAPVQVTWQRQGDTWTARIPPHTLTEPSVLRVAVKDSNSNEIGRGFVELEPVGMGASQ